MTKSVWFVLCWLVTFAVLSLGQAETATLSGTVMDRSGAAVPDTQVRVTNSDTNVSLTATTNASGIYLAPSLRPGRYRMVVSKEGFKQIAVTDIILNVQDVVSRNFTLEIGAMSESITVNGEATNINTNDATVGTVVDRRLIENMPLNGRSFQALIDLTPGVTLTSTSITNPGQFSVNGQRGDANYFTVDGVSANAGVGPSLQGVGSVGQVAASASGGYSNLASVDALQEFRVQTSTFAPEFGRTPGAQVALVTRSGTNQMHGSLFDYFRNDALDANNWFADASGLGKPALRQNDFGGVLGGRLIKDKLFYFFSYEGLRLVQPSTATTNVPSAAVRQSAPAAIQPLLNAFPVPTVAPACTVATKTCDPNLSPYTAVYSNPTSLNATSIRGDYNPTNKLGVFVRYNHAPSDAATRTGLSLNHNSFGLDTLTAGAAIVIGPAITSDFRYNHSSSAYTSYSALDNFGGAVPITDSVFPTGFSSATALLTAQFASTPTIKFGLNGFNKVHQDNFVEGVSFVRGSHQFKFGVDYLRLVAQHGPQPLSITMTFTNSSNWSIGKADLVSVQANLAESYLFHDFSAYVQDTWKMTHRLTVTYGLRWDVSPAASSPDGTPAFAVNRGDSPVNLAILSPGTQLYPTVWTSFAPRVGVAYQVRQNAAWGSVVRAGFGIFYDTANNAASGANGPYQAANSFSLPTLPLSNANLLPPVLPAIPPYSRVSTVDPNLKSPQVYQMSLGFEQSLGTSQSFKATYVGAIGRRLILYDVYGNPNPSIALLTIERNTATSDYHALQLQTQRRLSRGLQLLASYTWGHSLDNASIRNASRLIQFSTLDHASSDFDIRQTFSTAITYAVPALGHGPVMRAVFGNWSISPALRATTALPTDLQGAVGFFTGSSFTLRPDSVSGVPLYLADSVAPGGRRVNPAAFAAPPVTRQGTLGRNVVRGFNLQQLDFSLRREFALRERYRLQFDAQFFNVLNHPNFGPPVNSITNPLFGRATGLIGSSLSAVNNTTGISTGFSPLYQFGGPRSTQLSLRVLF